MFISRKLAGRGWRIGYWRHQYLLLAIMPAGVIPARMKAGLAAQLNGGQRIGQSNSEMTKKTRRWQRSGSGAAGSKNGGSAAGIGAASAPWRRSVVKENAICWRLAAASRIMALA
jgi:hypothetical protein